jgi:hypothetical protein
MVGVQASLIAAGSLAPEILRQLARRPGLARRYLAVEAPRALAGNEHVLPPVVRALIDHAAAASVPSSEAALAFARGRQSVEAPPRVFGSIDARRALEGIERVGTARLSSPEVPAGSAEARLEELGDDDAADERYLGNRLSSPVGGGGPIGRLLARFLDPVRERGGGGSPGTDAPTHLTRTRPGTGRRATASTSLPNALGNEPLGAQRGATYPEWDVRRRRYREQWCNVVEIDPPIDAASPATMPDSFDLRRSLARIGSGVARCRRQPQGDDIDIDAAVEARVDAIAGWLHDDDVYVESLRRRRDLSVLVLLDVSGSAGEPGTAGRVVHEHQRTAAAALTAALHELGDRVALYGFNSRGRKAVQLVRVKRFSDHLDGNAARRLDGLVPAAYTRLGAAIRHATAVIEEQAGTPRRLLVVISDGFA